MKYIVVSRIGKISTNEISSMDEFDKKYKTKLVNGYQSFHTWSCNFNNIDYDIHLFTKLSGKLINKYKFPPPFDNQIFYSECLLTCSINKEPQDIDTELWNNLYNILNKKNIFDDTELIEEEYDYISNS